MINVLFFIGLFLVGFAIGQLIMIFHQRMVWKRKKIKQHTYGKQEQQKLYADTSYFDTSMEEHASKDFR